MILLQEKRKADPVDCPYLSQRLFTQEYFFAQDLNSREFQEYLDGGWRRFGLFFFRPCCETCRECKPIRVPVESFVPSRSQRRNLRRNRGTQVRLVPPVFREDHYRIYLAHCRRFPGKEETCDREAFLRSYYEPGAPSLISEYYVEDQLVGVGYLDHGETGLSSVYFCFHPSVSSQGLGTFSVLKEIEICRELGLAYYYLGYYIEGCSRMNYKGRFTPHEILDWSDMEWHGPHGGSFMD